MSDCSVSIVDLQCSTSSLIVAGADNGFPDASVCTVWLCSLIAAVTSDFEALFTAKTTTVVVHETTTPIMVIRYFRPIFAFTVSRLMEGMSCCLRLVLYYDIFSEISTNSSIDESFQN